MIYRPAFALLITLCFMLIACSGSDDEAGSSNISRDASVNADIVEYSDFSLEDYDNKILILDFWATWCGPCRKQIPILHAFYEELLEEGCLEIIAVNLGESRSKVERFIQRYPMPYTIVLDQGRQLGIKYGVRAIPTMVILDETGRVIHAKSGFSPALAKQLKKLLHSRTPDCVPPA